MHRSSARGEACTWVSPLVGAPQVWAPWGCGSRGLLCDPQWTPFKTARSSYCGRRWKRSMASVAKRKKSVTLELVLSDCLVA